MPTTRRAPARRSPARSAAPVRRASASRARTATRRPSRRVPASYVVTVGQFGSTPIQVRASGRATVADVLALAGLQAGSRGRIWVNGAAATSQTVVKANDLVSIVTPKEAGIN